MQRREFIGLVSSMAAWPLMAQAQKSDRTRVIGVLMGFADSDPNAQLLVSAFREALARLGWTEEYSESNCAGVLAIDIRCENSQENWSNYSQTRFAQTTTGSVPSLPKHRKFRSCSRLYPSDWRAFCDKLPPGRNISGFTDAEPAMGGKWLQFLS